MVAFQNWLKMKEKLNIYKDNKAVAEAFATYLESEINKSDQFHIALSGGSTPKILFTHLATNYKDKIDWKKIHFYWGDERCVPPSDSDSNYGMTNERLLKHIDIPDSNIHRVFGENDPSEEAIRYSKEMEANLVIENKIPLFDLVILGMGGDGHTASIFTHQMELITADKTCEVATHPDSGQKRITITGNVINAAKQIHFLVTGASKEAVVKEIFSKTGNYNSYPASHIKNAKWWLDEAAT